MAMTQAQTSAAFLAANHLLTGGLAVTSTATPALNGTYAATTPAYEAMNGEGLSLALNANTFLDGTTSISWPDITGAAHEFSEAQFKTLINAVDLFVVQCFQYATGVTTTAPSGTATIP